MSSRGGNTYGKVVGDTPKSAAAAEAANPKLEEKNLLEKLQDGAKKSVDDWVERQGDSKLAMAAGAISVAAIEVFMPTAYWELIPAGKLAKLAKKGAEVAGVVKKGEHAAEALKDLKKGEKEIEAGLKTEKEAVEAEKKALEAEKKGDAQVKKKKKEPGPCDHLRQGSGTGPYRGGAHSKTSKPTNDGKDSHHMPAKDASPLKPNDGPAIKMDPKDHARTSSNGQMPGSIEYREMIADLISAGKWRDAMAIEIRDVRRIANEINDPRKYNEAMLESLEYYKCLEKNSLLK